MPANGGHHCVTALNRRNGSLHLRLKVDGIDPRIARDRRAHGADTLVTGTAFFNAPDKRACSDAFRSL